MVSAEIFILLALAYNKIHGLVHRSLEILNFRLLKNFFSDSILSFLSQPLCMKPALLMTPFTAYCAVVRQSPV